MQGRSAARLQPPASAVKSLFAFRLEMIAALTPYCIPLIDAQKA